MVDSPKVDWHHRLAQPRPVTDTWATPAETAEASFGGRSSAQTSRWSPGSLPPSGMQADITPVDLGVAVGRRRFGISMLRRSSSVASQRWRRTSRWPACSRRPPRKCRARAGGRYAYPPASSAGSAVSVRAPIGADSPADESQPDWCSRMSPRRAVTHHRTDGDGRGVIRQPSIVLSARSPTSRRKSTANGRRRWWKRRRSPFTANVGGMVRREAG